MKLKIITLAIALIFMSSAAFGQDEDLDQFDFETEPLQEEKPPYFAIAVGYNASFLFPDVAELNDSFVEKFGLQEFPSMMFMSGVQGFTGVVVVPNLRAGFFGAGGSSKVNYDGELTSGDGTALERSAEYSLSYTGFSVDYAWVPIRSLAILPGLNVGWGNVTLEAYQTHKYDEGGTDWGDFSPEGGNYDFMKHAAAGFVFVEPNVNIEFALTNFSMIRVSAGYSMTFIGSMFTSNWEFNRMAALENVPDGINGNGLRLQAGIFVGLFNY
jgi:hypothetical protein